MTAVPRTPPPPLVPPATSLGRRTSPAAGGAPSASVLERNLRALARTSAHTAELVRSATPRADVEFHPTDDGAPSCALVTTSGTRALCSRRRPLAEADVLAGQIDVTKTAAVAVTGFAAGHHVAALARKMKRAGVLVVFEPDLPLLRAVLERIDHSEWLNASNTAVLTRADEPGAMMQVLQGMEAVVMSGLQLLDHPPSVERLGGSREAFYETLRDAIKAIEMMVKTSMCMVNRTVRNATMNIDWYARSRGIADLAGTGAGKPAIVVSAGPSLARNVEVLSRPGVRERFVIIAAQTVLKTLLGRGIVPHFVTALDHSELSARFYEGLTARDVDGVTLVVEPKANAAILGAFPGDIRCVQDGFLDALLGEEFAHPGGRGSLPPGATVAHLAYYLARHLGCDPVILVGQDLGFTDGQYYAAGAAIHTVWSGELNEFRTLEMFEWERIKRMGDYLRAAEDSSGRSIYTDEQMSTYLVQFERDFAADAQRGLATIDATEGGVAKAGTTRARLEDIIHRYASAQGSSSAGRAPAAGGEPTVNRALDRRVAERVRTVRQDVWHIEDGSRRAATLLEEMAGSRHDLGAVNRLVEKVSALGREVSALDPAYRLVHFLNQAGSFTRFKSDRLINLDGTLSELERHRLRVERDLANVRSLEESARVLGAMLDDCVRCLQGAPKITRHADPSERKPTLPRANRAAPAAPGVIAIVTALADRPGQHRPDSPGRLRLTLARLARCRRLSGVVVLTDDADAARGLVGEPDGLKIECVHAPALASARPWGVRAGRLWASECWRGGLGGLTCYDEALCAAPMLGIMESEGAEAALIVGADWCVLDPALCDEVIARWQEETPRHRLTFAQAPPGIGGCVISRELMAEFARWHAAQSPLASVGGSLGYHPLGPKPAGFRGDRSIPDAISSTMCATVDPWTRDCGIRAIADSPERCELIARALRELGDDPVDVPSRAILETIAGLMQIRAPGPTRLILDICGGAIMRVEGAAAVVRRFAEGTPELAVTLGHRADPLGHPELAGLIAAIRAAGAAAVHVRTDLACESGGVDELVRAAPDVVSVNVYGDTPESYRAVRGIDAYSRVAANLDRLCSLRAAGAWGGWIVPRITRCDATYADVDGFYDRWLRTLGVAVIDPLPAARPGERIAPLPLPAPAKARFARTTVVIDAHGHERPWTVQEG